MGQILNTYRVSQNNQEYLLGIFKISEILKFTRYTEYTILGFDENNLPITNKNVQRKLNSNKVEAISKFLQNDPQAIFPTNIVISIPSHVIDYIEEINEKDVQIGLKSFVHSEITKVEEGKNGDIYLSIIDGQHRVRGIEVAINSLSKQLIELQSSSLFEKDTDLVTILEEKLENLKNFELPVSFFVDPVLEYQAMIFSTINRTQTRVSQDLVYSLFGLTEDDSPQKTALSIVNALNGSAKSPFHKRIRLAGASSKAGKDFYKDGYPILSQATMVKSILYMISKNSSQAETERTKPRKYFRNYPDPELLFRKYYAENQDVTIIKIINTYFLAVRTVFLDDNNLSFWDMRDSANKPTNILQTTIGYEVLLDVLKKILLVECDENRRLDIETYKGYLKRAKQLDIKDENNPKKYPFMNKTKKLFLSELSELIFSN